MTGRLSRTVSEYSSPTSQLRCQRLPRNRSQPLSPTQPHPRLFTSLPLPLFTGFGVHILVPFAPPPSREKLQNREETPARGTVYQYVRSSPI